MRKGISPFIAMAILLAVTVSISTIVFTYMTTTGRETREQLEDLPKANCELAGVQVSEARFTFPASGAGAATNYTVVSVENSGAARLPRGVTVSAFKGGVFVNATNRISALETGETCTVTFITNASTVTQVDARITECEGKISTRRDISNESYVSEPSTGVSCSG